MALSRTVYTQAVATLLSDLATICHQSPSLQHCLDACRARAGSEPADIVESISFALIGSLALPATPLLCRIHLALEDGRFYSFDRTASMAEIIRALHLLEAALPPQN